jgi:steroid 5-alpha reductase family enzyme
MFNLHAYLSGLAVMASLAVLTWVVSVFKRDVSIVDSLWSILFLAGTIAYAYTQMELTQRTWLVLILVAIWALRLTIYITARNWGEEEDRRYQAIRKRNQPNFTLKSLYIVFLLQALLAWIVSLPLLAAASGVQPLNFLDYGGAIVVLFGITFEALGDWQLSRFKADPNNHNQVMDSGLWRYTRHPNYFGECCVWWGFYLIALAIGAWWSVAGPLLMTTLLLKVSGVALLERGISKRRPEYQRYIQQTNAFIPGPRRS